jgi:hypothetical protein
MTSGATDEITPRVLRTPRAAGLAGIVFAVLFGLIVVLLRRVVPADPHDAGAWLTKAGSRREIQLALGLVPFCGIFFLWFMGAVRSRIGETEDKFLATVFLGSGLLFIAMLSCSRRSAEPSSELPDFTTETLRWTSGSWDGQRHSISPLPTPCGWRPSS